MDASDLMTRDPLTVRAETRCDSALDIMDDEDIRHLPVVDARGRLCGIVSDRDLLGVVGWPNRGPSVSPSTGLPGMVGDCMSKDVTTVEPEDSLVTATVAMSLAHVGCLPVVAGDQLVGIVSETDVAAAFWRASRDGRHADVEAPVGELMTREPLTIGPDTTLAAATQLCREGHFRHLPVVHQGKLLGVLSDRDLCTAFGNHRGGSTPAAEALVHSPLTTTPTTPLSEAVEVLVGHRISSLPVLDGEQLVGILTVTDVLDHCMNHLHDPESGASTRP